MLDMAGIALLPWLWIVVVACGKPSPMRTWSIESVVAAINSDGSEPAKAFSCKRRDTYNGSQSV